MYPQLLILSALTLLKLGSSEDQNHLIELPNGKIQGRRTTTFANTPYYSFKKIPYAAPPVGKLRFKAPQPAQNWDGILDDDSAGTSCFQIQAFITGFDSEDCLFVNVYTPQLPEENSNVSLPVMLFIYGGGFISGNTISVQPDLFIDNGVILVSINYRLGVFGFLSTQDEVIPGNNGLKDQHLAIKWTHDNIHLFGGDSGKILVFGQSAGSISTAFQMLHPSSQGLFRGAILESGTTLVPTAIQRKARSIAFDFAGSINSSFASSDDSETLLQFLQGLDAEELNQAADRYYNEIRQASILDLLFAPVIEVENPDAFITQKMYGLLQTGNFLNVTTLVGLNSEELLPFYPDPAALRDTAASWDQDLSLLVPIDVPVDDAEERTDLGSKIREIYTSGEPFASNLGASIRYSSDNYFSRAIIKHAELASKFAKTYFYIFSYDGQLGGIDLHYDGAESVGHSEEISYLFCSGTRCDDSSYPESDRIARKRLIKIWTDFAKYLDPTPEPSDLLQNITWPLVSTDEGDYFFVDINTDLEIKNHPKGEVYQRWTELYDSLNVTDFDTY